MTPDAFTCSYRQIGKHSGLSGKTAWKHVNNHLVPQNIVVIHDDGIRGAQGLPVLLGLVELGASVESVRERVKQRGNVKQREQKREALEAQKREIEANRSASLQAIERRSESTKLVERVEADRASLQEKQPQAEARRLHLSPALSATG